MKIRMQFTKTGSMRFIGHLDLMRHFQKVMRRAKVDIRYSGGYSPHQIMSFAAPLGLGVTSEAECVDIEVNSTDSSEEMIKRINEVSNDEIQVIYYRRIPDDTKNAMSMIAASDYIVSFREPGKKVLEELLLKSGDSLTNKLNEFYYQESIIVNKKTKKSEKEVDIRPLIYRLEARPEEKEIFLSVSAGSEENLKPELVMQAFFEFLQGTMPEFALNIHRTELYGKHPEKEGEFLPLADFGVDIKDFINDIKE